MTLRHVAALALGVAGVLLVLAAMMGMLSMGDRSLIEASGAVAVGLAGLGFIAIATLLRYWT